MAQLPVTRVTNLVRAMAELKEEEFWLVDLDERAEKDHTEAAFTLPVGIIMGGERKGLHELTRNPATSWFRRPPPVRRAP